jgi:hypothetical protein
MGSGVARLATTLRATTLKDGTSKTNVVPCSCSIPRKPPFPLPQLSISTATTLLPTAEPPPPGAPRTTSEARVRTPRCPLPRPHVTYSHAHTSTVDQHLCPISRSVLLASRPPGLASRHPSSASCHAHPTLCHPSPVQQQDNTSSSRIPQPETPAGSSAQAPPLTLPTTLAGKAPPSCCPKTTETYQAEATGILKAGCSTLASNLPQVRTSKHAPITPATPLTAAPYGNTHPRGPIAEANSCLATSPGAKLPLHLAKEVSNTVIIKNSNKIFSESLRAQTEGGSTLLGVGDGGLPRPLLTDEDSALDAAWTAGLHATLAKPDMQMKSASTRTPLDTRVHCMCNTPAADTDPKRLCK